MNETTIPPNGASDAPWPTGDHSERLPDTPMLPASEKAPPAAMGLLENAVQGAHDNIDRLADSVAPAVQQLGESVSAATDALHAKTGQLRVMRDDWADSVRTTVRGNPLVSIAAAAMLGALIARITR